MLHHTVLPVEEIFEDWEDFNPQYVEITTGSATMLVEPMDFRQGRIIRLISSDPLSYLDPNQQPGTIISL